MKADKEIENNLDVKYFCKRDELLSLKLERELLKISKDINLQSSF